MKGSAATPPLALQIGGDGVGAGAAQARERDMGLEVAALRRQARFAGGALIGPVQGLEILRRHDVGEHGARLVAAETAETVQPQFERRHVDLAEREVKSRAVAPSTSPMKRKVR